MSHFKDKLQVFIMGTMLGLLVGGGFFILKLDDYFKELNFYKHLSEKQEEKQDDKMEDKTNEKVKPNYKSTITYKSVSTVSSVDSMSNKKLLVNNYTDSLASKDSVHAASFEDNSTGSRDIVVKKDELLAARQVDLENLSAGITSSKDSLLQKISGVRDDKNIAKQAMSVEFWRSPINYKGYKMAKNKVVLFGIAEQEDIKLYHLDEGVFIKMQQGVYKLDYTNDFRQFERINDEIFLARLK
jgi:hypothetical protein